jgi:repressor LexA
MVRRSQGLSERHLKILEFLKAFQEKHGYSPSIRQIGDSIGVKSTSLIDYYLHQLENLGYINREGRVSRSIRITEPVYSAKPAATLTKTVREVSETLRDVLSIPIYGVIVAGQPIPMPPTDGTSYFDPESSIDVVRSMLPRNERPSELFALEVRGDSMIDAMVNDGDIVILRPAKEARNGEMVAVWLDDRDETTLKYFYREGNRVRLQPANATMQPIYIEDPSHLRIMGKVVMVIRQVSGVL